MSWPACSHRNRSLFDTPSPRRRVPPGVGVGGGVPYMRTTTQRETTTTMATTTTEKVVAYVFEDIGGWYICADDAGMLDTRGKAHPSKTAAIAALRWAAKSGIDGQYTHYRTGTTKPRRI